METLATGETGSKKELFPTLRCLLTSNKQTPRADILSVTGSGESTDTNEREARGEQAISQGFQDIASHIFIWFHFSLWSPSNPQVFCLWPFNYLWSRDKTFGKASFYYCGPLSETDFLKTWAEQRVLLKANLRWFCLAFYCTLFLSIFFSVLLFKTVFSQFLFWLFALSKATLSLFLTEIEKLTVCCWSSLEIRFNLSTNVNVP